MANVKTEKLRELTLEEIAGKVKEYKTELFNLRFQNAVGHLKNTSRIREVRKTVARLLTIASEKAATGIEQTEKEADNAE
ncbi:MAG: 50S ribosomal protein L29 [Synergistaceae bacterium]|nr:50S ribosomal protein L29 [Synergistaceae bacterium]MBQ6737853.1 50S ribosomal protein L29 [Synergistaceae bacterium]MBQ7068598.1 50S ribosomal protein L29 [Synergistaceae bacterium]MBR0076416.1 50S ribosomal protein L29 [Synergistaceae bacterium]MBR0080792.1 50S ribosomal protein L29 [Synergistaceae bacterium]